jgi:hypothetical protein
MSATMPETSLAATSAEAATDGKLNALTSGFGVSAVVVMLFNTLLAWVKDSWPALNDAMKAASGHHWITHGIVDIALFVILGLVLTASGRRVGGTQLAMWFVVGAVVGGAGLGFWFLLV